MVEAGLKVTDTSIAIGMDIVGDLHLETNDGILSVDAQR